ncbi:hypothetical protein, conserved [Entamoeba dispar SAW760]|uniref:RING-type domain-containing protein n=1 Tax=Entamoeba dispar (strain ATCC PRA-260 / SAW760) TaxID=370354 RepID=B0EDJ4_ENTDS|nr:uncharacterized protein EDI_090840 [Entamoeba dispar SAW760]EDR27392.1 hypothetical protein, conserved [Entamoeba dispar SAW760]|eukprot:EDR27392.1 hypothetical protein, conserved [Entamoeba dispar SAW760]
MSQTEGHPNKQKTENECISDTVPTTKLNGIDAHKNNNTDSLNTNESQNTKFEQEIEMGNVEGHEVSLGEEGLTQLNELPHTGNERQPNNQNNNNNNDNNNNGDNDYVNNDYSSDIGSYIVVILLFFFTHIFYTIFIIVDFIQHYYLTELVKQYINTGENKIRILAYCIPSVLLFIIKVWQIGIIDMIDITVTPNSFINLFIHLYLCDCLYRYVNYYLKALTIFLTKNILLLCKLLSMIESITLALRVILPTFIIYNYLILYTTITSQWINYIAIYPIIWIYVFGRCRGFVHFLSCFFKVLKTFFTQNNIFGTSVTLESLEDKTCLICQDTVNRPIKLKCGHVYCEECIFKWLIQQPRCPMCRDLVVQPQTFVGFNGNTRFVPALYFF